MTDVNQGPALSIQTSQLIAQVVSILGMLAAGFGWLTPTQVAGLSTNILAVAGPLATIGGIVWSFVASRKTAVVSAVAAMPEVRAVITEPTTAGRDLATNGTPPNVVVAVPGAPIAQPPSHL